MATQTNQKQLIAPSKGEIILYQTADGRTSIDVKLENETVWLSSEQMALLFERDRTVIQRHIRNIYNESELTRDTTCAKFAHMGRDGDQTYVTELFNLDVIISVGYRVKSQRGTQFRIWANSVLKDYLIKGYAVKNDLVQQKYDDLKALVDVMGRTMGYLDSPADDQIRSIFDVVKDYTYALDTLDSYDYQNLRIRATSKEYFHATYDNAMEVIRSLKAKFGGSDLFAHEKDQSFHLVVKNHSFTDGNKRIAATLFLWFMENNHILYAADGHKRIADNALVALTLMIAESKTEEMDIMVKVVVNLINGDNK